MTAKRTVSLETLMEAPETLEINGMEYSLQVYLSQDTMPPVPPEGPDLKGSIGVAAYRRGSSAIRGGSSAIREVTGLWLVKDGTFFTVGYRTELRAPAGIDHTISFQHKPRGDLGAKVDVIVQLTDNRGKHYLLRAVDQPISELD